MHRVILNPERAKLNHRFNPAVKLRHALERNRMGTCSRNGAETKQMQAAKWMRPIPSVMPS